VLGRKDENMVEQTITQIEERIKKAKSLKDERKKELLDLLSTLKSEVSQLSKTDADDAQSIIGFTQVSIHEAIREEKHPQLLTLSLKALSTSVKRFENSHPKLVGIVNSICNTLSNVGI
jgi:hypothetical protein